MTGIPRVLHAPSGVVEPLDVRDPEVVLALAETVAILGADFRPRLLVGHLGVPAGFERADDITTRLADWIHKDDHAAVGDALMRTRHAPGVDVAVDARVNNSIDGWHAMTLVFRNLLDHPDVQGILVRANDQTVFERESRFRTLVGESPIGIFELDRDDCCTFVNPAFERLTGLPAPEALGEGWRRVIDGGDLARMQQQRRATEGLSTPCVSELRVVTPEGAVRWVSARSVTLRDGDGVITGHLGTLEDVTDRKRLEERLEHDATHDRLTGLGSRALLVEELRSLLAHTRRGGPGVALLFIDLDGFKRVNDMLGHTAGDELLVQFACRLRSAVREGDLCIRLGGDEFVVCCSVADAAIDSMQLAERMLAAVAAPYDIHGHEVVVSASIGIATARGEDPVSVDQMLSNADVAAYRAKRLGRGRIEMFDDALRRQLARGRRIARTVGRLLEEPRIPIICNPIVQLETDDVVGFDCVVDWAMADIEEPPDVIARVLEESALSRALDFALVRTVLAQLAEWQQAPPGDIVPGLSVSLTQSGALSPALPERVREMLAQTGVPPALCWLGVPESAVVTDLDSASRVATGLDALGVGVALRDFGSAVSSLDQLRRLPAPTITVAGSLVRAANSGHTHDDAGAALLAAIVQYARALRRIVIAFDVQDAEHARRLHDLGCEFGVGPAFGPRMTPGAIAEFLANRA